ncbi:16S rRNA (cytosine(1402)-N(4))-methyltransferase RsmH [Brevundimonas sp. 2R-24]|uniref:Ribosomal RNA small subunit methyltransferase H n=1 Tax=Peiella sedimenti TaxID=3061083 RepID=A0ABT8SPI7_9CAUL|nr:16S rRNA (cytosine(1402)-N(4))-methyltransferase RsmH [Caulobacteraceae bacterium XZ-24]
MSPHAPVLLTEVIAGLALRPGERVIDGTFGAGGYSRAMLEAGAEVLGLDRDPTVRPHAERLKAEFGERFRLIETPFSEMEEAMAEAGWDACDAVVLDVGVSSMQLDQAERGFSFMRDGPLDMRMAATGQTAADLVNTLSHGELAHILKVYGEERQSGRIATAILRRREVEPFTRTADLAEVVEKALGGRRGAPIHPATRTFQALRIAVNDELGELSAALEAAERILKPGGRLAVVSFHSLEDRIVKAFLAERSGRTAGGSRHMPQARGGPEPTFSLPSHKAVAADEAELAANPRARSAKLRVGVRTHAPAWRAAA